MTTIRPHCYAFSGHTLDPHRRELRWAEQLLETEPKVFDLIEYLLKHRERVVTKNELQEALWPNVVVTEASLSRSIMKARRALDDDAQEPRFIRTVPRKGFRFIAEVREPTGSAALIDNLSDVRFVPNGDVHIAWRTIGNGSPDVLFAPGFVSHLDLRYRVKDVAKFDASLAENRRLITFDRRGVGLSDRVGKAPTLEDSVADMLAVMDAAECEQAIVFAVSESGPAAGLLAARYPERVKALILYGTFARGLKDDDYPHMPGQRAYDAWLKSLIDGWGGPTSIELFSPSYADDPMIRDGWARYLRAAATPGSIKGILEAVRDVDVRAELAGITCPTLVLHRTGDKLIKCGAGRDMAAAIPDARFTELAGDDHWWFVGDAQSVLEAMQPYLD